jgi:catechol 2,3-dioxygenase-like lactoylglutathione lyase family enzyme
MLGYCTLGTNDIARAGAFYDGIAEIMGTARAMASDRFIMWGTPGQGAMLSVITPYDGQPATVGNGSMFGIHATSEEQVDQVHAYALANGGSCEGPPGPRGDSFYCGYFRDPDGNKLIVYLMKG